MNAIDSHHFKGVLRTNSRGGQNVKKFKISLRGGGEGAKSHFSTRF